MKKIVLKSSIVLLTLGFSSLSFADNMDMQRPDDSGAGKVFSAERVDKGQLDDGRMSNGMFDDDIALDEAFTDQQLLAELDLDDINQFDSPYEDGLLDDR